MNYTWQDYNPDSMGFVEHWLDESAVQSTGLEDGFRAFYEYWANEDGFLPGQNLWCKVVFENNQPFAIIALCLHEHTITIMEVLVAPEHRGLGKGARLLAELLSSREIIGFCIQKCAAAIYPDNIASQKAFEHAGFIRHHSHKDVNGESLCYVYDAGYPNAV